MKYDLGELYKLLNRLLIAVFEDERARHPLAVQVGCFREFYEETGVLDHLFYLFRQPLQIARQRI